MKPLARSVFGRNFCRGASRVANEQVLNGLHSAAATITREDAPKLTNCVKPVLAPRARLSLFLVNDTSYRAAVLASVSSWRRRGQRGSIEGAAQGAAPRGSPSPSMLPGRAATRREAESGHSSYHSGPYR